jgi:hypothetical protein
MYAFNNGNQTSALYVPHQYTQYYIQSSYYSTPLACEKRELSKRQLRLAEEAAPFWQNKGDAVLIPPVALALCVSVPFTKPRVVRWATVEWRARRLAATRRHMPLRSRPGAR